MKKYTAILLAIFYLLISVGIVVNIHYCHGFVASVKLFEEANCGCDNDANSCCHNEMVIIVDQNDEKLVANQTFDFKVQQNIIVQEIRIEHFKNIKEKKGQNLELSEHSPPTKQPIRIMNCSFTFYG